MNEHFSRLTISASVERVYAAVCVYLIYTGSIDQQVLDACSVTFYTCRRANTGRIRKLVYRYIRHATIIMNDHMFCDKLAMFSLLKAAHAYTFSLYYVRDCVSMNIQFVYYIMYIHGDIDRISSPYRFLCKERRDAAHRDCVLFLFFLNIDILVNGKLSMNSYRKFHAATTV